MNAVSASKSSDFGKSILVRNALPADNQDPWQCGYEFGVWRVNPEARKWLLGQMDIAARLEKDVPNFASFEVMCRPEMKFVGVQMSRLVRAPWFDDEVGHHDLDKLAVDLSAYAKPNSVRGYDCAWATVSPDRVVLGFGVAGNSRRVWTEEISREFLEGLEFSEDMAAA